MLKTLQLLQRYDLHQGFLSCFKEYSAGRDNYSEMAPQYKGGLNYGATYIKY